MQQQASVTGLAEPRFRERVAPLPLRGVPALPRTHVDRPRLVHTLKTEGRRNLALVSAPAGSGKTALLAEWVRSGAGGRAVGWLTFEPDDERFWLPFTVALHDAGVPVPATFPGWSGLPPDDRHLAALVRSVRRATRPVAVVLDNWEPPTLDVLSQLDVLLRHCAGRLLLVIGCRSDPRVPLARYRLEDTVLELRMADLAFTDPEAGELLSRLGVKPGPGVSRRVNTRVHGWAAGLVFLARALRRSDKPWESVAHVLRHTSEIDEYLVSEVLDAQPTAIRQFLLRTADLDTLCPDQVERLLGPSAVVTLQDLLHRNTFIEPDPEHSTCFRYQDFFRDVLRAQHAHESARRDQDVEDDSLVAKAAGRGLVSIIPQQRTAPEQPPAIEPLTPRETEVLWHLEELLTTEEMAATMFVSVNTVRTHVRSVLRKLGVDRRNAAVRRGRELGLIPTRHL